jgi:hypothetical protein
MRGKMLQSETNNENVTSYLMDNNGKKSLIIINKQPETKAVTTISIPGFSGKATMKQLRNDNAKTGYSSEKINVNDNYKVTLPPYSITTITVE